MATEEQPGGASQVEVARLSADVVAAYVSNNTVAQSALPDLIRTVHGALTGVDQPQPAAPAERQKPAVPISRSVQEDYIVCLEDGTRLKMLKRYLRSRYNLTPEEYRRKWGRRHTPPAARTSPARSGSARASAGIRNRPASQGPSRPSLKAAISNGNRTSLAGRLTFSRMSAEAS